MTIRHAYLHGFASSSQSSKGQALRRHYAASGRAELHTPDLNFPSFAELTYSGMLAAFDAFDRQLDALDGSAPGSTRWRLIGSSMGGWVTARWAELHPERVDRVLLLCPAFDFTQRWPLLLGADAFARWRAQGSLPMPDATKQLVDVHFGLYRDAEQQPARPPTPCPTVLVHGTRDTVVPIDSSREYAAAHGNVELVEVDDDHLLVASLPLLARIVDEFLLAGVMPAIAAGHRRLWWEFFGPDARGTAEHFRRHLDEFLAREHVEGCSHGVVVDRAGQAATWCVAPHEHLETLVRALAPRRVE
jgi:pimeloyl-ACP methyl ester carboxylesterase